MKLIAVTIQNEKVRWRGGSVWASHIGFEETGQTWLYVVLHDDGTKGWVRGDTTEVREP